MSTDDSTRLLTLRTCVDALLLGEDGPDVDRLHATLAALDPGFAGDAVGDATFDPTTGMPSPTWIGRLQAFRDEVQSTPGEGELPDAGLVQAVGLDPELAARLMSVRSFRRFLLKHDLFPAPSGVRATDDGPWWTEDRVLPDGRWGRIRVRGSKARTPSPDDLWYRLSIDDLSAEVAYDDVRRTIVGPVWRADDGQVAGLWVVVESIADGTVRRLLVDRMRAEQVELPGVRVVPVALPG